MRKDFDVIKILLIVIIGMFFPFLVSIIITFNLDITNFDIWLKIGSTFGYFLLIFAIELFVVMLYFSISNKIYNKKLDDLKK